MKSPRPPVAAVKKDPADEGFTKDAAYQYAAYLDDHARRMKERRDLADEYTLAAVVAQTFTPADCLVLTPEGEVNALETAGLAIARAFAMMDLNRGVPGLTDEDHVSLGQEEAEASFETHDTFPDQEALAVALAEIGESIRAEAIEAPKAFAAWQTDERARMAQERAKRRGKR